MINDDEKKSFEKNYKLALRYLTRAIKTELEVKRYLERRKANRIHIQKIIEKLKEYNYIDDDEYTRIYAENKKKALMSPFAVKYGLRQKGIHGSKSEKIISKVFSDFDEKKVARDIALKKANKMIDIDIKKKLSRISSFLRRKGFPEEAIYYAMEPIFELADKDS